MSHKYSHRGQTHLRFLLEWANDKPFRLASSNKPSFPEYMLSTRLDGEEGKLSAGYVKKVLGTARSFFSWLSDNEEGYRHIKQAWIKTIKTKRLSDVPKNKEAVSLEEIQAVAAQDVRTVFDLRTRAAIVFLFLSGMRIGAFVSLPIRAVDIQNRTVTQYPSLGVRTKNSKYAKTYLLEIPELLKVVQEWDSIVRSILPPDGLWFAPFSSDTGKIDPNKVSIGEHRSTLARRNIKTWLESVGLPYHSPHKFRHGHVHYGLQRSKTFADYKAVSQNVGHSSTKITDETYSNLNDGEVQNRITKLASKDEPVQASDLVQLLELVKQILEKKQGE